MRLAAAGGDGAPDRPAPGFPIMRLTRLAAMLPAGSHWGLIHEGMQDFRLLAAALGLGATAVRTGYEDGRHLAPGEIARSNVELVSRLVQLVRLVGLEVATPAEARTILGVSKR